MKKMLILLIGVMFTFILTGCETKQISYYDGKPVIPKPPASEIETHTIEYTIIEEERLREIMEVVEYDGISYQIMDVCIGKMLGDRNKEQISYRDEEQIDEEGNLTSAHQYIWIKLKMKNVSEEKEEFLVNKTIVKIGSDREAKETFAESRYVSPLPDPIDPMLGKFHTMLESGEEKVVEIGYVVEEKLIGKDSLYYVIPGGGLTFHNPAHKFIYLGELINEE